MRFSPRKIVTTALVAAIVVPYVGYLVRGSMPFVDTAREMAATALLLGLAAARVAGGRAFRGPRGRTAGWIGVLATGGGTALIVWAEPGLLSEMLLALFIGSIVVIWAMTTLESPVAALLRVARCPVLVVPAEGPPRTTWLPSRERGWAFTAR